MSRSHHTLFALFCIIYNLWGTHATFVVEEGGIKVSFPPEAKTKYPGGFDMALANFGAPKYGGAIMGRLVYVDNEHGYPNVCSPPCNYACQDYRQATPPVDLKSSSTDPLIMIVDRGPVQPASAACKFAQKVWNAQQAGARAVIVVNFEDKLTTMEAPDGDDESSYMYLKNISIPASFVTLSTGVALKTLMKSNEQVYITMDWTDSLPRQKQVEWEFWTNSNDMCGASCDIQKSFISSFLPIAEELDKAGYTRFTPHYIIWVCPQAYKKSAECRSQCIHHGRYCAPDPDGSITQGYSGAEVVQENLRQLCVFRAGNASSPPKPYVWWEFSTKFAEECSMDSKMYNQECAEKVFHEINKDGSLGTIDDLNRCIGNIDDDTPHAILEEELKLQAGGGKEGGEVFILPTIRINGAQYRGKLDTPEVLRALCAGFEGNRPPACDRMIDDACMIGGKGYTECSARKDGKTACVPTISASGYNCTCGSGFISHKESDGSETCLDINECLSVASSQLPANCTCERCACKNTFGGYECVTDIIDECAKNYGGCWHSKMSVKGKSIDFSACHDNLNVYKDALAHGQPTDGIPLHNCTCPACFTAIERRGTIKCEPKCSLEYCDLDVGVCHAEPGSGGVGAGALAVIIVVVVVVVAGGAFVAYKLYMKGLMQAEVRQIMAQYMPLSDVDGDARGLLPVSGNRRSDGL